MTMAGASNPEERFLRTLGKRRPSPAGGPRAPRREPPWPHRAVL